MSAFTVVLSKGRAGEERGEGHKRSPVRITITFLKYLFYFTKGDLSEAVCLKGTAIAITCHSCSGFNSGRHQQTDVKISGDGRFTSSN